VSPLFSLTPPPEAVQEKGDLNSYVRSPTRNSEQDYDAVLHSVLQKSCTTEESYKKTDYTIAVDIRHDWRILAKPEI